MVFRDSLYDAQWLRTAGHASSGGADLGECLAAASRIRERDAGSWFDAWFQLAAALVVKAERSAEKGRRVRARSAWLRAANYFRAAYTFLMEAPVDPRLVDAYRRQKSAFEKAAALMEPRAERVAIPYEKGAHSTVTCFARPAKRSGGPR